MTTTTQNPGDDAVIRLREAQPDAVPAAYRAVLALGVPKWTVDQMRPLTSTQTGA